MSEAHLTPPAARLQDLLEDFQRWREDYTRYHVGAVPIADEATTWADKFAAVLRGRLEEPQITDPEEAAGILRGLADVKAGRVRSLESLDAVLRGREGPPQRIEHEEEKSLARRDSIDSVEDSSPPHRKDG